MRILKICLVAFFIVSLKCAAGPEFKDGSIIVTNKEVKGTPLTITITRGTAWGNPVKISGFTLHVKPQMAFWVEDSTGKLLQNIYITKCFAKQEWKFLKSNPDSTYRTMSLPYWMNKLSGALLPLPTKNKPLPDAITSATPSGSFTIKTNIDKSITQGFLWCEVNSSFDNNEMYSKDKPDSFNGQPSILYKAEFNFSDTSHTPISMNFQGHGGDKGSDGVLYQNDRGITTAKQIISSVTFVAE